MIIIILTTKTMTSVSMYLIGFPGSDLSTVKHYHFTVPFLKAIIDEVEHHNPKEYPKK